LYSIERAMNDLPKWVYWTMGKEVVSSVVEMLANPAIDGIVNLVNASCGPDSFMIEIISRSLDLEAKPYMTLTIDEHASTSGLETRVEAFFDMVSMRKDAVDWK
ncbi:MAG: 2-hydroxyacyl-CoA dehydratase, partial [Thermodesulfovibrionales bacterium]